MCISPPEIAQVIAPYTATGAEQLTLAPGQLILIRKKNPGGWWEGELQVCKFPDIAERYYCLFIKRSFISSLLNVRDGALSSDVSLRVCAVQACLWWNLDGSGVTLWPNTADLFKVLPQANLNQPNCLGQFDPPPVERDDETELFFPLWDSIIINSNLTVWDYF